MTTQPEWITQPLTPADLAAILEGGCASGAYMPAVTYHQAMETMGEHGDDVLEYVEGVLGEMPAPPNGASWSQVSTFYLSFAVELWCLEHEHLADWEDDETTVGEV